MKIQFHVTEEEYYPAPQARHIYRIGLWIQNAAEIIRSINDDLDASDPDDCNLDKRLNLFFESLIEKMEELK